MAIRKMFHTSMKKCGRDNKQPEMRTKQKKRIAKARIVLIL
jgi:hypothetical protein